MTTRRRSSPAPGGKWTPDRSASSGGFCARRPPKPSAEALEHAQAVHAVLLRSVDVYDLYSKAPAWFVHLEAVDARQNIADAMDRYPLAPYAWPEAGEQITEILLRLNQIIAATWDARR